MKKKRYLFTGGEKMSKTLAFETTLLLCKSLLEEINTPRALSVHMLICAGEWDQLAEGLPIDAKWYTDSGSFFLDWQATCLLIKADFLPTSFDKKKAALVRFERAESQCQETNRRWRACYVDGVAQPPPGIDRLISRTKSNIQHILGRFPYEKLLDNCRWGPGATTSILNPRTSVYEKYLEPLTGSGRCLDLFLPLVGEVPLWSSFQNEKPRVVNGNKVVVVKKNAKSGRTIAKEPTLNSFFQLGVGRLMRIGLLRHGVDLSSQIRNQQLARYGSITGKVATVDEIMASDMTATVMVEEMFPADWLVALKGLRSTEWRIGGESGVYHKFSSMGNGYTFELESVLFYAAAQAVAEELHLPWWEVTVFGDDITIGVEGFELLTTLLSFLGYSTNKEKSFKDGPFRESCGKDYFLGDDVRPYFVRSVLRDVRDLMKFHNGILRGFTPFQRTAAKALRLAEPKLRLFGPKLLGDTVFYTPAPRGGFTLASKKWPMFEGYIVRHWVFKPTKLRFKFLEPAILASLYSNKEAPTDGYHILRKRGIWETRTVLVPGWD